MAQPRPDPSPVTRGNRIKGVGKYEGSEKYRRKWKKRGISTNAYCYRCKGEHPWKERCDET